MEKRLNKKAGNAELNSSTEKKYFKDNSIKGSKEENKKSKSNLN